MKRFIECFSEHFETEFSRRRLSHQKPSNGTVTSTEDEPDYTDHADHLAQKPTKPFFRRLSFKGLKKGKVIQFKIHSSQTPYHAHTHTPHERRKTPSTTIVYWFSFSFFFLSFFFNLILEFCVVAGIIP